MNNFKTVLAGCILAASSGLALPLPVQAEPGPAKRPVAWEPRPAELCTAMSVSKHYTLADADFGWVRDQLNATLAGVPSGPGESLPKALGFHIPVDAVQFGLRLDHARCDRVPGPISRDVLGAGRDGFAKDCRDADCEDPAPGWTAPEGSVMVIWTCINGVFREVEYKKVGGRWKATRVREERVTSCPLPKDPGDGTKPDPGKG